MSRIVYEMNKILEVSTMQNTKLFLLMLVSICLSYSSNSIASADSNESGINMAVSYNLIAEESTGVSKLKIKNTGDKLQFAQRPDSNKYLLEIKGLNNNIPVYLRSIGIGFDLSLVESAIPLKPNCAIEIPLGLIAIKDMKEGTETELSRGNYTAVLLNKENNSLLKDSNLPEIIIKQKYEQISSKSSDLNYPLSISIEPFSEKYTLGKQTIFNIRMQNNSGIPIKLFNYFDYSYKQNFTFSKKFDLDNTIIPEPLYIHSAITPHAINDWLLLFPGESLILTCDVSDEFKNPGKYKVSVTFFRGPIVLFPTDGKPRYTEQNKWTSKEVEIEILENND